MCSVRSTLEAYFICSICVICISMCDKLYLCVVSDLFDVWKVIEAHSQVCKPNASRKRPRSYSGFRSDAHALGHSPGRGESVALREACSARLSPVHNSNQSVTAVEWMGDGQKFITAGQDGLVKVCGCSSYSTIACLYGIVAGVSGSSLLCTLCNSFAMLYSSLCRSRYCHALAGTHLNIFRGLLGNGVWRMAQRDGFWVAR